MQEVYLFGFVPNEIHGGVSISSLSLGSGRSGNIKIFTGNLNLTNGSYILTSNVTPFVNGLVTGGSGDININATNSVEVSGTSPDFLNLPSSISAATFSTGQAGNVNINTSILKVNSGGTIDSSTGAYGSAGSVTVNAPNLVEVAGVSSGSQNPSSIISSARTVDEGLLQLLILPPAPTGNSGNVEINTTHLNIDSKGLVSVRSDGSGNSGTLKINSDSINLSNGGSITAASASGEGGNIFLRSQSLQLLKGSSITTDATGGSSNGGNIDINTDLLTLTQGSSITANAVRGNGGNININTFGLFQAPDSPITATSQLGINGTVQFNTLQNNPTTPTVQLPKNPVDATKLIVQGCPGNLPGKSSSFTITGRGGLPPNPYQPLDIEPPPQIYTRSFDSTENRSPQPTSQQDNSSKGKIEFSLEKPVSFVQADTVSFDSQGNVVLSSSAPPPRAFPSLNCDIFEHMDK